MQAAVSAARMGLLLTDDGLPDGINGRELANAARQRRLDLKILYIIGYADAVTVGNGQMQQCMQVMVKLFELDSYVARVQGIIGR